MPKHSSVFSPSYFRAKNYESSGLTPSRAPTTFQVPESNLTIPENGPLTSGGALQYQLTEPAIPGSFVPTIASAGGITTAGASAGAAGILGAIGQAPGPCR